MKVKRDNWSYFDDQDKIRISKGKYKDLLLLSLVILDPNYFKYLVKQGLTIPNNIKL